MDIQRKQYFSIFADDKPGEAARITASLMRAEVDLEGLWAFGASQDGRAQFIAVPRDSAAFERAAQNAGWRISAGTCFRISGEDRRGALVETLKKIADSGINLRGVDAMAFEGEFGCYLWAEQAAFPQLEAILLAA